MNKVKEKSKMFYKEDMELKLLQFRREQLYTEIYILKKSRQLYDDALFWNELAGIYNSGCIFVEADSLLNLVDRMIN